MNRKLESIESFLVQPISCCSSEFPASYPQSLSAANNLGHNYDQHAFLKATVTCLYTEETPENPIPAAISRAQVGGNANQSEMMGFSKSVSFAFRGLLRVSFWCMCLRSMCSTAVINELMFPPSKLLVATPYEAKLLHILASLALFSVLFDQNKKKKSLIFNL